MRREEIENFKEEKLLLESKNQSAMTDFSAKEASLMENLSHFYNSQKAREKFVERAIKDEEFALLIVTLFIKGNSKIREIFQDSDLMQLGCKHFSVGKEIINESNLSVDSILQPIVSFHKQQLLAELSIKEKKEVTGKDLDNLVKFLGEQALEQINVRQDLLEKLVGFYYPKKLESLRTGFDKYDTIERIAVALQKNNSPDGCYQPETIIYQTLVAYQLNWLGCQEIYENNVANKLFWMVIENPNHRCIIAEKIVKVSKTYKPTGKDRDILFDAVDPNTILGKIFYPNEVKEEEDINQVSDGLAILYAEINARDENKLTPFQKKVVEVNELFEKAGRMEKEETTHALQKYAHCYLEYGHQKSFDRFIVLAAQNKEEAVACIINYAEQGKNTLPEDALNKEITLSKALFPTYKKEGYGKLFQNDKSFHKLIEAFKDCGCSVEEAFPDLYAVEESSASKTSLTLAPVSLFGKKDLPPPPSPRSANFNSEVESKSKSESKSESSPNQDSSLYQL